MINFLEIFKGELRSLLQFTSAEFYQTRYSLPGAPETKRASVITHPDRFTIAGHSEAEVASMVYGTESYTATTGQYQGNEVAFRDVLIQMPPDEFGNIVYFAEIHDAGDAAERMKAFSKSLQDNGCNEETGSEYGEVWERPE